jgi:hypothetical protein
MFMSGIGQDSTQRDSLLALYTKRPKSGDTPGGEAPAEKEPVDDSGKEEKKEGLFRRIFNHRGSDKEEAKHGGGGN